MAKSSLTAEKWPNVTVVDTVVETSASPSWPSKSVFYKCYFSKSIRYTEELLHEKTNIDSFNTVTDMRDAFKFKFVETLNFETFFFLLRL